MANFIFFLFFILFSSKVDAVTSVNTSVSTSGNSYVKTETNVESNSSSTTDISVSNSSSTIYTDSDGIKAHKKIEVSVNGKKKVLETTEPGTHTLTVIEPTIAGNGKGTNAQIVATPSAFPQFPYENQTLRDYIIGEIKRIFSFFPLFSAKN
jgi:hypothetical protein